MAENVPADSVVTPGTTPAPVGTATATPAQAVATATPVASAPVVVKSPEELEIEAQKVYESSLRAATLNAINAQVRKDNAVSASAYVIAGCAVVATAVYAFKA